MAGRSREAAFGSAVFVGTARDCAGDLPRALATWSRLAPLFSSARFLVAENDSVDATKAILARWAADDPRRRVLCLDGLAARGESRSRNVATCRNRLLDEIRTDETLRSADFLVVMDMDDASILLTPERLARCMAFEGWDALFANQLFYYNDVWALRDANRSPDDFVPHLEAAPEGWRRRWARLRHLNWRNRPFLPWGRPIPVTSAFGGFAVYRMSLSLAAAYRGHRDGRDVCEHVPLNETIAAAGGRLFLHPGLVNTMPRVLFPLAPLFGLARPEPPR